MDQKRDYSHEHELRKKRTRRLIADLDKDLVTDFKEQLEANGVTFADWLKHRINEEQKGQK